MTSATEAEAIGAGIENLAHAGEAAHEPSGTEHYGLPALGAALALGCVALLMLGVQPLVLGALLADHRITVTELTLAATVEMLALGVVSAVLAGALPHRHLRVLGAAATLMLALANFGGLFCNGAGIIVTRGLVGLSGGVVLWIGVGLITRSVAAVRISGIFAALQSLSQAGLAAAIPLLVGLTGSNTGFVLMGAVALAMLPLVLLLPNQLSTLPKPEAGRSALSLSGAVGLAATFLMMAGVVGFWVFIEALGRMNGVDEKVSSFTIAASLATQILGAGAVAIFGPRLPAVPSLVAVGLGNLAVIALIAFFHGAGVFVPAALLFGFLWTLGMPLIFPLLIRIDPTRRVAMLSSGAQLLGSAAGPILMGFFATEANVRPVLPASALLFCAAILAIILAGFLTRRSPRA